ncbi:MAG: hypothetical protein KF746_23200 [Chitinophagaceae bacterium]|nr:hypothetical protein [Chitinophagaceae bacterium]
MALLHRIFTDFHAVARFSLIFFNRNYSHIVLKKPAQDNFRVQHIQLMVNGRIVFIIDAAWLNGVDPGAPPEN